MRNSFRQAVPLFGVALLMLTAGCDTSTANNHMPTPQGSSAGTQSPRPHSTGLLTAAEMAADLLPGDAFGIGLINTTHGAIYADASPTATPASSATETGCDDSMTAFLSDSQALSFAGEQYGHAADFGAPHFREYTSRYSQGLAAAVLNGFKAKMIGPCSTISDPLDTITVAVVPVAGLGDEAFLVKDSNSYPKGYSDTIYARYGDILASVTIDCSNQGTADSYNLKARIQQLASNMGLS